MWVLKRYVEIFVGLVVFASCKGGGNAPAVTLASNAAPTFVSYAVTPNNTFVPKGQNLQFTATATMSDNSTQNISANVSWTVDDNSVASINSSGLMSNSWTGTTGVKVVNVSAAYLGDIKTVKVTIIVASLSSIYVNPNSTTVNPGSTGSVAVIANYSDGSTIDVTSSVSWSSSDASVATGSLGVISGISNGSATLTASYSGHTATLSVTVGSGSSGGGTTTGTGLKGDYYTGIGFSTFYGTRTDSTVNFNWGQGVNNLGQASLFTIRWTGQVKAEKSETYTFYTQSDDGVRLYIDGALVIDNWTDHATTNNTSTSTFAWTAGSMHDVVVEYYENQGYAVIQLSWSSATTAKQIVPQQFLYPAP
ncbi:MAG: PA14 domain-containing protein [Pseudobdellovibrio sp.]